MRIIIPILLALLFVRSAVADPRDLSTLELFAESAFRTEMCGEMQFGCDRDLFRRDELVLVRVPEIAFDSADQLEVTRRILRDAMDEIADATGLRIEFTPIISADTLEETINVIAFDDRIAEALRTSNEILFSELFFDIQSRGVECFAIWRGKAPGLIGHTNIFLRKGIEDRHLAYCIREELLNAFGLGDPEGLPAFLDIAESRPSRPAPIFYGYTVCELELLRLLYSDAVSPDMPRQDAIEALSTGHFDQDACGRRN